MTFPLTPGFKDSGTGMAAAAAFAPKLGRRQSEVLEALEAGPQTAEQIAQRTGRHWYLVRPRLSELKTLGLATPTGATGVGALGGRVNVWRLTTANERAAHEAKEGGE